MAGFSATEAAFTGFRIVRERPRAVAIWAGIQIVVRLAFAMVLAQSGAGAALARLQSDPALSQDPARLAAMFGQLAPVSALGFVYALVFYPVLFAAMARAVLEPHDDALGYLRLGRDEVRQFGLMLWMLLLGFIFYVMTLVAAVVIAVVLGVGAHGAGGRNAAAVLTAVVVLVAFLGGWVFIAVRLSLASPLTFARRRVDLFGSWTLTRDRFWPLLGTYCLALALAMVVYMLGFAVITAASVVAGGGMGAIVSLFSPDYGSLSAVFQPARLIQIILGGALTALIWPVVLAPAVALYRSLSALPVADAGHAPRSGAK